jgi:cytochrome P450
MDLGLDSMHLLEMKLKLDALAGNEIPLSAFLDAGSAAALARLVVEEATHGLGEVRPDAGPTGAASGCPFHEAARAPAAIDPPTTSSRQAPGPDAATLRAEMSRMSHSFPDYLVGLSARYGDIVRLDLGGQEIHLIANPDELDAVMVSGHDRWLRRGVWAPFRGVMGDHGLITTEGAPWREERRFANPRFSRPAVEQDVPAIARVVSRTLETWSDAASPVDLLPAAKRLTLEIILDKLFGEAPTAHEAEELYNVLHDIDRLWNVPAFFLYANQAGARQEHAYQERLGRRLAVIDRCLYAWIDRLLEAGPNAGGVLGAYARAARESAAGGRAADDMRRELRDIAVTYILTGFDTTASGIYWTVTLLLEHPAVLQRVADETAGVPDAELPGLPHLRAAVQEALRLYPPVWYVGREATADTTLRGYAVPEGSFAIASPYVVHRNPSLWPDPSAFRPERFLPGASPKPQVRAYMPFGLGARICIGMHFALAEIAMVAGILARDHRLARVAGDWRGLSSDFTLTPREPIQLEVSSRAIALR